MKFEIRHRFTGAVLFSLETESLNLCVRAAIKSRADLRGADLRGDALSGAALSGADLRCADLRWANLSGADLSGAALSGADLGGAEDVAQLGYPDDWPAFAWHKNDVVMVQVGCKSYTLQQGREYWAGKANRREVMAALDYAEAIAKIREWK